MQTRRVISPGIYRLRSATLRAQMPFGSTIYNNMKKDNLRFRDEFLKDGTTFRRLIYKPIVNSCNENAALYEACTGSRRLTTLIDYDHDQS